LILAAHYRAFGYQDFKALMTDMKFQEIDLPDTMEYAFEHVIANQRVQANRFKIQILSSVDKNTGITREVGSDAIRILLLDTRNQKPVASWVAHRTTNAFTTVRERARDAFRYVTHHPEHHCSCGALMSVRKSRGKQFLGCSTFPVCKETKPING
jgi:hypothetical protein